jgi:hypothetical protein
MAASSISTQNERIGGPNTASKAPQKEKVYSDPMRYASISGLPIETVEDPENPVGFSSDTTSRITLSK